MEGGRTAPDMDTGRLLIRIAIEELVAAYTYHHDRGDAAKVRELLTDDITVKTPDGRTFSGAGEIIRRLEARPADRLVRHAVPNIHVTVQDADHAEAVRLMVYYAADPAHPAETAPKAIADYCENYVRGADGRWRIAARVVTHLFGQPPA